MEFSEHLKPIKLGLLVLVIWKDTDEDQPLEEHPLIFVILMFDQLLTNWK